jgi:hypothetical protein
MTAREAGHTGVAGSGAVGPQCEHQFVRAQEIGRMRLMRNRSTSSGQPAGGSPVRGDARVPGSEVPVRRREAGCEAGWIDWPVRSMKRSLLRRECSPPLAAQGEPSLHEHGEGHGTQLRAWSGCGGTPRRTGRGTARGLSWELGRPSSAPPLRGREQRRPISGSTVKGSTAERESEGVVVVTTVGTTQPGQSEGPLLHPCTTVDGRGADECRKFG